MLSNARNFIIQNGSFTNVHRSGLNGLEILQQHVFPDALHDSLERSNPPKCHPNTRTAVLKDILSWVEDDYSETQVLWLHGPAGAGKTAIGHSVVEMTQKKNQFAAGFFFSRTAAGRNHDKCLIATISYQFLQSIPEARSFIEAAATEDPLIFMKSLSSQIRHLIVDPLKQMLAGPHNPSFPRLIVIDGLDECSPEESQTNILTAMHSALGQDCFPFRVLICSRAEPNIRDIFESELANSTHKISLDDKYEPDIDIALYLRSKFSDIVRKHRRNRGMRSLPLPWPSKKAIQTLVSNASGQFIYAATVIRYVDVRHQQPDERLKIVLGLSGSQYDKTSNPFIELDELYQEIFRAVVNMPLTSRLLGALLILKTPLPIGSLEDLLGLQPGDAELALCQLHSVVRMPNDDDLVGSNHIGLYHASLGDFLFDSQRAGVYHIEMESAHATLAECCLRKISKSASIQSDMVCLWLAREDPAAEYAWHNWIYHFLNVFGWNDKVIQEFRKLPRGVFLAWLTRNRRSIDEPPMDLQGTIDQFNTLKSWFIGQDANHKSDGVILGTLCKEILELYFTNAWADILGDSPQNVSLSLGILAVVLRPGSISSAALATLFKLDWVGFSRATFLIRPYINFNFGASVNVACDAFSDFISNPEHVSEFNPNTPDVHADLVIRCVECISLHPSQDKQTWHLDPEGAYEYSVANWKDHLRQASSRRLLDYAYAKAYAVTTRFGHQPICTHENPCDIVCEVDKTMRCIESTIIVTTFLPYITSTSDIKLLKLLKDIMAAKYLDTAAFSKVHSRFQQWSPGHRLAMSRAQVHLSSSNATRLTSLPEFISSLTARSSSTIHRDYQHASSSRTQVHPDSSSTTRSTGRSEIVSSLGGSKSSVVLQDNQYTLSSRTSEVDLVFSSTTRVTGLSDIASPLGASNSSTIYQDNQYALSSRTSHVEIVSSNASGGTSLSKIISSLGASNSSIVHRNYQYASSLWKDHLRHANSSPLLESPSAITCACLSELDSVPGDVPELTPDDHARLVIRVIECIAAHHPIDLDGQCERQPTLGFDSASEYRYALFKWKNHLHHAEPRRLLNYAYVFNVRSGHQPICAHEKSWCHLLCEVPKITRCIESRIIDGEFFPHTLSVADTKTLKLLREIIDVKYLQTPLFTSINSRIQSWSDDYRLAIARTVVFKSADAGPGPSTARGSAFDLHSN